MEFSELVATDGASNIIQHEVKFSPGGTTGWHPHPGIVILTWAADSGPVDWYDSRCGNTVYNADVSRWLLHVIVPKVKRESPDTRAEGEVLMSGLSPNAGLQRDAQCVCDYQFQSLGTNA
jgi:hypothetical protein